MAYISATIILQLMTAVVPQLSKLVREEGGRAKIIQYGRYLTLLLCIGQGAYFALGWENPQKSIGAIFPGQLVLIDNHAWYLIEAVLIMTTGTMLLMWLGEQITERGIGNGVSLIITIGILQALPMAARGFKDMYFPAGGMAQHHLQGDFILLVALLLIVVAGVIA